MKKVVLLCEDELREGLIASLLADGKLVVVAKSDVLIEDIVSSLKEEVIKVVEKELEDRKKRLGRIPTPPPTKVQSSKKGDWGYNRKREKARQRRFG